MSPMSPISPTECTYTLAYLSLLYTHQLFIVVATFVLYRDVCSLSRRSLILSLASETTTTCTVFCYRFLHPVLCELNQ